MKDQFLRYSRQVESIQKTPLGEINSFIDGQEENVDAQTVDSFGSEWNRFDDFSEEEIQHIGNTYFDIVPDQVLDTQTTKALDVGCGSGRWTKYLANKVHSVECIDPSDAVFVAQKVLEQNKNIRITRAAVESIPFENESFDFVFSLGVLHHVPNTHEAIVNCVQKLKKGGHFLVYLYYNLDNRGVFFRLLLSMVTLLRKGISKLPSRLKFFVCDLLAFLVYLPLVGFSKFLRWLLPNSKLYQKIPLSYYGDKTLNVIRNDALDRFGTPLEQRFSKVQITQMMEEAGLSDIQFSTQEPYWHAIGTKA